jgi:hypothetical protein
VSKKQKNLKSIGAYRDCIDHNSKIGYDRKEMSFQQRIGGMFCTVMEWHGVDIVLYCGD